ncbi:MerR family transcriptional regulator [Roseibium aestuarii]|uniref:MerR family transcriptional regulator n=1 Tax=Roseibium aestuarii TaxID=2600299 RepID=A0ABW4JSW4_9HYPH|nr:MerR family transcriptional regulator [Roseibium aestuarii]
MSSQDKAADAFRTISEVAEDLDLPQHVLRFWETRFSHIKPLKRGGGRRYYRPDDVELLRGIRHLLYGEGYTIKGVQRILKDQGPRFVMQIWQEAQGLAPGMPLVVGHATVEADGQDFAKYEAQYEAGQASQPHDSADEEMDAAHMAASLAPQGGASPHGQPAGPASSTLKSAPAATEPVDTRVPRDVIAAPEAGAAHARPTLLGRLRGEKPVTAGTGIAPLSKDDVKALQTALMDLLECKRLLDQAR